MAKWTMRLPDNKGDNAYIDEIIQMKRHMTAAYGLKLWFIL